MMQGQNAKKDGTKFLVEKPPTLEVPQGGNS